MDIITTSSTQEILRHNKYLMRYFYKLLLKQEVDKKSMIDIINCSMLESLSTSDDNEMENGVSKSTALEPTIKYLMK